MSLSWPTSNRSKVSAEELSLSLDVCFLVAILAALSRYRLVATCQIFGQVWLFSLAVSLHIWPSYDFLFIGIDLWLWVKGSLARLSPMQQVAGLSTTMVAILRLLYAWFTWGHRCPWMWSLLPRYNLWLGDLVPLTTNWRLLTPINDALKLRLDSSMVFWAMRRLLRGRRVDIYNIFVAVIYAFTLNNWLIEVSCLLVFRIEQMLPTDRGYLVAVVNNWGNIIILHILDLWYRLWMPLAQMDDLISPTRATQEILLKTVWWIVFMSFLCVFFYKQRRYIVLQSLQLLL